jgi:mannan endo-1,4-beta-mannosidase
MTKKCRPVFMKILAAAIAVQISVLVIAIQNPAASGTTTPGAARAVARASALRTLRSPRSSVLRRPAPSDRARTTVKSGAVSTPTTSSSSLTTSLEWAARAAALLKVRASTTTTSTLLPSTTTTTSRTAISDPVSPDIGVALGGLTPTSTAHLTLNGKPYQAVGVNAYEIASDYGVNAGCGPMVTDAQLDQFFASLPPHSLVRFSAFQGAIATDVTTHQINWGPLDRIFQAAAAYGQYLVPVLTGQGGYCDGQHWQDPSWYAGGFKQVFNTAVTSDGQGLTPLSYWDYVQAIVNRYKSSPALGMWEPVSEADPETCPIQNKGLNCTCPNEAVATQSLRYFFDVVSGEIHSLDPNHLVESGLEGGGQCGTAGSDYEYVSASQGIDVMSFHDYYGADDPLGGPTGQDVATRLAQAAALDKPIIGGEIGLEGGTGPTCMTDTQRALAVATVTHTLAAAGSNGLLWWDWVPSLTQPCNWDIAPGDPLLSTLTSLAEAPVGS